MEELDIFDIYMNDFPDDIEDLLEDLEKEVNI